MLSAEFLRRVGDVQIASWADGARNGLLVGHPKAKRGLKVEDSVPFFRIPRHS
jgi:hypothetical protein